MESQFENLNTSRLILRKFETSDWETIAFLRSDIELNKYIDRPLDGSKEAALAVIKKIRQGIEENKFFSWAIILKESNLMMGSICLWNLSEDRKTAEVGYDLKTEFQGKGYMNESMQVIMKFGLENLSLKTIEAFTHRENLSSIKLLERNNFKLIEGRVDEDNSNNIVFAYNSSL